MCPMYALIYDEHMLDKPQKKVISIHDSREDADVALEERKKELGRKVYECNTPYIPDSKQKVLLL